MATTYRKYRQAAFGLICGLLVQLFIGMMVNLFVTLPKSHPGSQATDYFDGLSQGMSWAMSQGPWQLMLHIIWGTLLTIGGLSLVAKAWKLAWLPHRAAAIVGLLAMIFASFNGASYVNYGQEVNSLLMASGLIVAIFCYSLILLLDEPNEVR